MSTIHSRNTDQLLLSLGVAYAIRPVVPNLFRVMELFDELAESCGTL